MSGWRARKKGSLRKNSACKMSYQGKWIFTPTSFSRRELNLPSCLDEYEEIPYLKFAF
jgi:hypothetical protein